VVSALTALGSKEAETRMIGCDLHAAQQTIAMLDRETGEIVERTLKHDGTAVREFYAGLTPPVVVGIEAKPYYLDTQTSYFDHVAAGVV
jgi:hypothetical protein